MLKQFFKDGVIYSISNIITRGISILLVPFYTRILSPADYGIIDMVAVVTTLVNLTVTLEITQAVARFFGECKERNNKIAYASSSLWFTFFMYTMFSFIALYFQQQLSVWILGVYADAYLFKVALLAIWCNGIFSLLQSQLRWDLHSREYALTGVISSITSIGVTIFYVIWLHVGVSGVFWGLTFGNGVGACLAGYFARRNFKLIIEWDKLKRMLHFSLPLVPSSIGVFISLYIDRIAIRELLSFTDLGLYGIGYRVASIANLLMVGFQGALMPLVYTHYQEDKTPRTLAKIFRYFMLGALAFVLSISVLSREILMIFTTPDYYDAAVVIPILVPAVLLSGMYIFAPGLGITQKTKIIAVINIIAAGLNTGLNFLLIPYLGINGSALATLLSAISCFTGYLYYGQKYYYVPYKWRRIGYGVLFTLCLINFAQFVNVQALAITIMLKIMLIILGFIGITKLVLTREELELVKYWVSSVITSKISR